MTYCWAEALGDCAGGISGEHLIPDAILAFLQDLTVLGYAWCRTTPRHIGPASLVANHLCKHHNSELSGADASAVDLFKTVHEIITSPAGAQLSPVLVDGLSLERFFLKSAINMFLTEPEAPTWSGSIGECRTPVPMALVEAAFGRRKISPPAGTYFIGPPHSETELPVSFTVTALHDPDELSGAIWLFHGLQFLQWFTPQDIPEQRSFQTIPQYHPAGLRFTVPSERTITLQWDRGA